MLEAHDNLKRSADGSEIPGIHAGSSATEVQAWLEGVLQFEAFGNVQDVPSGREMRACKGLQDMTLLLRCPDATAQLVIDSLACSRAAAAKRPRASQEAHDDGSGFADENAGGSAVVVKPEPGASPARQRAPGVLQPEDAHMPMQDVANVPVKAELGAAVAAAAVKHEGAPPMHNDTLMSQPEDVEEEEDPFAAEGAEDEAADPFAEVDEDEAKMDDAAGQAAGGAPGVQACLQPLQPIAEAAPVVLPDGEAAQAEYVDRALMGISNMMKDCYRIGKHCFDTIKPKTLMSRAMRYARRYDGEHHLHCLERHINDELASIAEAQPTKRAEMRCTLLNTLKACVRDAFGLLQVQSYAPAIQMLRRLMPIEDAVEEVHVQVGEDIQTQQVKYPVIPEDIAERLWNLAQAQPLLCELSLPVWLMRGRSRIPTAQGVTHLGRQFQKEIFCGPSKDPVTGVDKHATQRVIASGLNLGATQQALILFEALSLERNRANAAGGLSLVASFVPDPDAQEWAEKTARNATEIPRKAEMMRLLKIKVYVEVAMHGDSIADGLSGVCISPAGLGCHALLGLLQLSTRSPAQLDDVFKAKLDKIASEYEALTAALQATSASEYSLLPAEGAVFDVLLETMSNRKQDYPEGFAAHVAQFLKRTPKGYQLATMAKVQEEEQAEGGLQRHFWIPMPLLDGQAQVAWVSPVFDAICVADQSKLIFEPPAGRVPAARRFKGHRLYETSMRGGFLALEVGTGKTMCAEYSGAADQGAPAKATMHTVHTEEGLKASEEVQVGRQDPDNPDFDQTKPFQMFTGFKQKADGWGTVVPDGSVTFTARGNLVVVPPPLAAQWETEIAADCATKQRVVVIADAGMRRECRTSVDDMRMLAEADWVIATSTSFMEEFELYECFEWRRVFIDEAHQINGKAKNAAKLSGADAELRLMRHAARLRVSVARWCLSGTPLRNAEQITCLNRALEFLRVGFTVKNLTNTQLLYVFAQIAIRYTKAGYFQGEQVLPLPPVLYSVQKVALEEEDDNAYVPAMQTLAALSGIPPQEIARRQAQDDNADTDDDPDDVEWVSEKEMMRRWNAKNAQKSKFWKSIIQPARCALAGQTELRIKKRAGTNEPDMAPHKVFVKEPPELVKPKDLFQFKADWLESQQYRQLSANYTRTRMLSKVNAVLSAVDEAIETAKENEQRPAKCILFSNWQKPFMLAQKALKEREILFSTMKAATALKQRRTAIRAFMNDPHTHVFLLERACGVVGLNLTAATHVFIMEPAFGPQLVSEEQAVARAHRFGQQGPLQVTRFVLEGTIEERLHDLVQSVANGDDGDAAAALRSQTQGSKKGKGQQAEAAAVVQALFSVQQMARLAGPESLPDDLGDDAAIADSDSDGTF